MKWGGTIMAEDTLLKEVKDKFKAGYILNGLSCSSCAAKIEKAVEELDYVTKVEMNFAIGKITVKSNKEKVQDMSDEIQQISDRIEPGVIVKETDVKMNHSQRDNFECDYNHRGGCELSPEDYNHNSGADYTDYKQDGQDTDNENAYFNGRFWPGTVLFFLSIILFDIPVISKQLPEIPGYIEWLLYGSSYLLIGGPVLMSAFKNIKRGQVFDENFLMVIATLGAFAIQEFPEGVAVMLFYMIGEMFQDRAVDRSRRSIKTLMDVRPDYANLKHGDTTQKVDPNEVRVGDIIIIKPGEKVPLDGEVLEGSSMVDTSALTGESVPRKVKVGDQILSGMINKDGLITVKVDKEFGQSTVAKILELVENASGKKAPIEKFITKFARYYTPVVVYTALGMALLPPLLLPGATFFDWVYRALIFLVVSCPCALVVSIPLGFFGGIGRASQQGVLIKGGNYLEALNDVNQIVFDKTGTLTKGKFMVSKVKANNSFSRNEILSMAAYAESHSTHPIAKSIKEAFDQEIESGRIEDYQEISGKGIKAVIDGREVLVGNTKLMAEEGIKYEKVEEYGTIVYLGIENDYAGYITITDELKEDSVQGIKGLRQAGVKELTMLTGDREGVAERVARRVGLDKYYAELLPDQKVEKVEELLSKQDENDRLIFVGDGINDAPVLARSDIGVAMGGLGSDAAIEAADIVLMTDEPSKLITAINIAKRTKKIVWQNIIMALGVKGLVLVMGALGIATMWEAVFADVGVALLAVLNSMRISRKF